jgi:hypothetical protein
MAGIVLLVMLGTSGWVFFDAPTRDLSRWWSLGCLLLWVVAFPWYLVNRTGDRLPPAPDYGLAPGWYPDPIGRAQTRWFDGQRWTDAVQS